MIYEVESIDRDDTGRMTATDFPTTFLQFKEASRHINESKAP